MLLTLTACSSDTGGFATPSTTSNAATSSGGSDSSGSQSSNAPGGKIGSADQLANTQACDLLTASEATRVGLPSTPSGNLSEGAKSGCQWTGDSFAVVAGIRTDVGLSGVIPNGTITDTTIGSHTAKKLVTNFSSGAGGTCLYAIGVTDSMRVDITSTVIASGDACQESLAIAQIIEPKLP